MTRGPAFVAPRPAGVSGGHVYNAAVLEAWPGPPPEVVTVEGDPPDGPGTAESLRTAIAGRDVVLVDGLTGAAHPEVLGEAEAAGTQVVLLIHLPLADETGLSPERRSDLASRERESVAACSAVVATSRTAAGDLAARYGRQDIVVASPGTTPAPVATGSTPPHLLCLASITPRKNHLGLLAALTHMDRHTWTATFAGPAPDAGHLAAVRGAITDAGLAARIDLLGPVTGAALEDLWARTNVLVLPSLTETYGLVVTEAVARGIPVVVAAGTGAVEALADARGADDLAPGLAADASNSVGFATAITEIASHPRWRRAARRARASLRPWTSTAEVLARQVDTRRGGR